MGRRKKRKTRGGGRRAEGGAEGAARTSLADLLRDTTPAAPPPPAPRGPAAADPSADAADPAAAPPRRPEPRPSDSLRGADRIAYLRALEGVRPIGPPARRRESAPGPPPPPPPGSDAAARARLGALVGGGVRFDLEREGEAVRGLRAGAAPRALEELSGARGAEAELDLHGLTAREAEDAVARFVRRSHRRGLRTLLIVHGRGLHSEGGAGVLGDVAVRVLTDGGAAPVVLAFTTAPRALGGPGALLVRLRGR